MLFRSNLNIVKYIPALIFLIVSCVDYQTIPQEHEEWKLKRKNALFADDGYLNLAGLYPIQNGRYTIGSLSDKDIHIPSDLSENLGEVLVYDSIITFTFNENVLLNDSLEIREITYNHIKNKFSFSLGSFIWFIHFDSGVKAIRLRNLNHPLLGKDLKIDFFDSKCNLLESVKFKLIFCPEANFLTISYIIEEVVVVLPSSNTSILSI